MAFDIQYMDNFSVFGTVADMLNGSPWGSLVGCDLVDDPDPTTPLGSKVLVPSQDGSGGARLSLPTPGTSIRVAFRLWMTTLPTTTVDGAFNARLLTSGISLIYKIVVQPSGAIKLFKGSSTLLADSGSPVIYANSWNHFEFVADTSTGAIKLYKEGVELTAFTVTDGAPGSQSIAVVAFVASEPGGNGSSARIKDDIFASGTGQLGPCTVYRQNVDGTISSGWTATGGADETAVYNGYSNLLTATGNPSDNQGVTIGAYNYRWTTGSLESGPPNGTTYPWLMPLGATTADSLASLAKAINASGVAGVDYSTGLTVNPLVTVTNYDAASVEIKGKTGTPLATACSVSSGNLSWKTPILNQGPSDLSFMSAGTPPPDASIVSFEDLPISVTAIRSVMTLARQRKSDGGDATVQISLNSGASTDPGADRAISTAFSYYWDVSEFDPSTMGLWTPAAFNACNGVVNRTT